MFISNAIFIKTTTRYLKYQGNKHLIQVIENKIFHNNYLNIKEFYNQFKGFVNFEFILFLSELTPSLKSDLYKKILTTLGIGAKTNVGYGQFVEVKPKSENNTTLKSIIPPSLDAGNINKVKGLNGVIEAIEGDMALATFTLFQNDTLKVAKKIEKFFSAKKVEKNEIDLKIGDEVIMTDCKYDNSNFVFTIKKV